MNNSSIEQPSLSNQFVVDALRGEIETRIARLRELAIEPVGIRYTDHVSIEVRPAGEDDRLLVCHATMGHTNVNYMDEGLVVDVWPNEVKDGAFEPLSTQAILADELQSQEAA